MKFAIVSDDGKTISKHFGRAQAYLVFTAEAGRFVTSETRPKLAHHHGAGHAEHKHDENHGQDAAAHATHTGMAQPISDCEALISGGMGRGAYQSLERLGIRPIITDFDLVEDAVAAYLDGSLQDHPERLH